MEVYLQEVNGESFLKDTPETWRQIEVICEVTKRHGARVNHSCGAHVHIGMNKLDTARKRWRRFFKMIENYEEYLYRAAGGDLGRMHQAMQLALVKELQKQIE